MDKVYHWIGFITFWMAAVMLFLTIIYWLVALLIIIRRKFI